MCVRCGTGTIAWCEDPTRHEGEARPLTLREIENETEKLIRHAVADRLPVDAGVIGKACQLIGKARLLGYREGLDQGRVDGYYGNLPPCPECKQAIMSGDGHAKGCEFEARG